MGKIIGLTYDLNTDCIRKDNQPQDAYAEFDPPEVIESVSCALESYGHKVIRIGNVKNLLRQIDNLAVDIVFNLAEGFGTRNRESWVPNLLEIKEIPFVGADGLTTSLTLDKLMAKKVFISERIPTPRFLQAGSAQDLANLDGMKFPFIVKPRFEGSSKGLSDKSKVENIDSLREQVNFINKSYNQGALIEEFISGSEFTVAIIGNTEEGALPPVQIKIDGKLELGDLFYTFGRLGTERIEYICPAQISAELDKKMRSLAWKAYKSVDCVDFGRVDFRVDKQGNIYVLEINPLPSLHKEDVFGIAASAMGISYDLLINNILEAACKRLGIKKGVIFGQ